MQLPLPRRTQAASPRKEMGARSKNYALSKNADLYTFWLVMHLKSLGYMVGPVALTSTRYRRRFVDIDLKGDYVPIMDGDRKIASDVAKSVVCLRLDGGHCQCK